MVVTTTAAKRLWRHVFRRLRELTFGADGGRPRRRRRVLFAAVCGRLVRSVGQGRSPCRRWENSRRRRRWSLTLSRRLPSAAPSPPRRLRWSVVALVVTRAAAVAAGALKARRHAPLRPGGSSGGTTVATAAREVADGREEAGNGWFVSRWPTVASAARDRRLRPVDELVEKGPATHVFPVRKSVRSRGLSRGSSACPRQPGRGPWARREKRVSPEGVAVGDVGVARWARVVAPGGI